ncbi:MAG: ADP-ribosylglycohydrolase family protein [Bacteroidaceae bacterium]|nr:ADP-ribosylglycohydrolase family protein [Bacteroidaceae bacterium]
MTIKNIMLGCLYGQAVGDALGLGTEFMNKNEVRKHYPQGLIRYDQIIQDDHRCRWAKGSWTDDTDMMICIMDAFDGTGFNYHAIARNFKEWFNGDPLGIGGHTFKVLCMSDYAEQPEMCSKLWWDLSHHNSAANGALMRTSVVGLAPSYTEEHAETICRLTHYDPRCIGSCVIASSIIHNLVWHNKMLSYDEIRQIGRKYDNRIAEWIGKAYNCSDISLLCLGDTSIGYTLLSLSAALWCYWHAVSFENGLLLTVNEGGDADTNAAIACSILGAKFGYEAIPQYYIENLSKLDEYKAKVSRFINETLNEK